MSDTYTFPIQSPALRRICARDDERCPECGGPLDTGWECNDCGFDAMPEAYPQDRQERDANLKNRGLL